jgi:EAL domain-containing protein (putative c-di-GMP-specific phosphodiesterase class I)
MRRKAGLQCGMTTAHPSDAKMNIADLHFLVAEDHDFQRKSLALGLKSLGAHHIREAADGCAAFDYFSDLAEPVDIIICDLEMPNMDGLELIRHVGEAGAPVSVILTSAMDRSLLSSVEMMTRAYGIDLLGAIEKPATPQKLRKLIGRHGARRKTAWPSARTGLDIHADEIIAAMAQRQFVPYFQPKVELQSGEVVGAEALVRWNHPRHGLLTPGDFLDLIEAGGSMDELTWMMLEESAAACLTWHKRGWPLNVSVNLSLSMLADPAVADRITQTVEKTGLPAHNMTLEITESAAMTDVATGLESLVRLRMRGFGLSIDDYGTGYSSMQQLGRIPFTELKIDKSFVTDCSNRPQHRVMLESSIDMAGKLGLKTVAEGIETRADWNLLKDIGCTIGQGHFMAKALAADAFIDWVPEWAPPE